MERAEKKKVEKYTSKWSLFLTSVLKAFIVIFFWSLWSTEEEDERLGNVVGREDEVSVQIQVLALWIVRLELEFGAWVTQHQQFSPGCWDLPELEQLFDNRNEVKGKTQLRWKPSLTPLQISTLPQKSKYRFIPEKNVIFSEIVAC